LLAICSLFSPALGQPHSGDTGYTQSGPLGCELNGHNTVFRTDWGDGLDNFDTAGPSDTWLAIEGDPLLLAVYNDGTTALYVCQSNRIQYQYYSEDSWGTNIWLNGKNDDYHYSTDYFDGNDVTPNSHSITQNGDEWEVVTIVDLDELAQLKQVITYRSGDLYYKMRWELTNTGGESFNDVRFFHGGDTYFGGDDDARSWWNADQNMIYVNNLTFSTSGIMGFYGAPATPANHYFGGYYSTSNDQAESNARLRDVAVSRFVDAGYELEWDRESLSNQQTWIIEAYEAVTHPTSVQVLPPADQLVPRDTTITMEFVVHNLEGNAGDTGDTGEDVFDSSTFSLSVESDQGWTTTLPDGDEIIIGSLQQEGVTVQVVVPAQAPLDTINRVTLTATDINGGQGVGSTTIALFEPNYDVSPNTLDFGDIAVGE
ncbi:MAG: hypothetical protein HN348_34130, partial [Proteobacteria bacterium]|nr:hypothetical protein [Pseudomonadota bacterium]